MAEHQASYRQIMKATSLFGGVQVFLIVIQVIRSKFVAILLGPHGMGISGLLYSTLGLIKGFTDFGLGTSAVKDIAAANGTGDQVKISTTVTVIRRLVWLTGTFGAVVTLVLSSWLSKITFGNHDYTLAFIWISVTLLLNQLSSGQIVLLQGMRKLQNLAKANLAGSTAGLIVTVPLYYFFGIDGIVPGIIATSLIALTFSWYFSHKVKIEPVKVSYAQTVANGKGMLNMGFMISLSGTMAIVSSYIVRIFIRNHGGITEVGFYNAGFTLLDTYVGLIFTAMSTDYYPRLTAVAHDNSLCRNTINQQVEIALLILAPILVIFLVFINWVVILLYSNKFIPINQMIYFASLGVFFKAPSWAIAFILLAKGSAKLFLWNELVAKIYFLILNLLGYYILGLVGLGVSYLVGYTLYLVQIYIFSRSKFDFSFSIALKRIFILQFILALTAFATVRFIGSPYKYFIGLALISVSGWYSFKELDKRLGLKAIISDIKDRYIRKK
jgi:O-antigen/teichoic acid export membrane protein